MQLRSVWDSYWSRAIGGAIGFFIVIPLVVRALGGSYALGVYIGTGIAVSWYTVETYYLRREMARQNKIAILPLIVTRIDWKPMSGSGQHETVVLRNIGRGPALFVQVEDINIGVVEGLGTLGARFGTVDIIEEKQEVAVDSYGYVEETGKTHKAVDTFVPHLKGRTARKDYEVIIRYEDTDSIKHESVMGMGKSGTRLLRHH